LREQKFPSVLHQRVSDQVLLLVLRRVFVLLPFAVQLNRLQQVLHLFVLLAFDGVVEPVHNEVLIQLLLLLLILELLESFLSTTNSRQAFKNPYDLTFENPLAENSFGSFRETCTLGLILLKVARISSS